MVKVIVGAEERDRLIKVIFEGLLEKTPMGKVRWETAFSHDPIGRAFKKEMLNQLDIVMQDLLDCDEFRDKMTEIGRAFSKKFFKQKVSEIVDRMMKMDNFSM